MLGATATNCCRECAFETTDTFWHCRRLVRQGRGISVHCFMALSRRAANTWFPDVYLERSVSESAIWTKPASRVAGSVVRFVRTIAKCTPSPLQSEQFRTSQRQGRHEIAALQ